MLMYKEAATRSSNMNIYISTTPITNTRTTTAITMTEQQEEQ
jgi:hypothetical protein